MPSKDRCEIEINIRTPRKLKKIGPLKKKSIEWVKLKTERWVEIEGDLDRNALCWGRRGHKAGLCAELWLGRLLSE